MNTNTSSRNFSFLAEHDPLFIELSSAAERAFSSDPNTTLIKLRQLGEALAQHIAALVGIAVDEQSSQIELLNKISRELQLEPVVRELFHTLRIEGNKATHQFKTKHREAINGLIVARNLAIWFHQSFGKAGTKFKAGAFVPPADPSAQLTTLQAEISQLKTALQQANIDSDSNQQFNDLIVKEKDEYQALALAMDEESRALATQVAAHEAALAQQQQDYEAKLAALQTQLAAQDEKAQAQQRLQLNQNSQAAAKQIDLNEELTRILIDQQLNDAGWEADSDTLTYKNGSRPAKGKNIAIAEWPTEYQGQKGRADYVLFADLIPIGIVEAKRENTNVAGKISQAERYSRGLNIAPEQGIWADGEGGHYQVPFVYSCNGRPYVRQLAEQSGTWFRDVRHPANVSRALAGFHSAKGLLDKLKRQQSKAEKKLAQEPFGYLKLRPYQQKAIEALEVHLAKQQRQALLAMATGTGKTRTIVGLIYRFLKAERFKRILFLVDRTALGNQTLDTFDEMPLEQNQSLSKIYNIVRLSDKSTEAETRVQVATVQAMVKRLFNSDAPPAVDQFDCIIVDEAHRGYTLDQEMTEGEMATRDASQYLSSYRRVLDYFDAVKIGLTATPAKHTSDIFGKPIYTYSYREAVADDWLIDHEPPIRYQTVLTKNGIHFDKGEMVSHINTQTGAVESAELDDELHFDIEGFNLRVINENFNRVICQQLAQELKPFGKEKTLIFCATDVHADMVKRLLDEAFKQKYADKYNQAAVAKVTGKSDKVDNLIRQYKNEPYPNIAITVDLLTTGIDVPKIAHLVFMRRVKSRILYEQMIGRATRRCDAIGKTVFRIYDPVDIYAALEAVNTMKPLVKQTHIDIAQLITDLSDPKQLKRALNAPGEHAGQTHADVVLEQLSQKIMQVLRKADYKATNQPELKQKLATLHSQWGIEPKHLHQHLHSLGAEQAAAFLRQHPDLLPQLNDIKQRLGSEYFPVISEHEDELLSREQSYGEHQRPEDYIENFNHFIQTQINQSAALAVVVNKPRDLTRKQLKEIILLLNEGGYTETQLQSAIRTQTNQDIAAGIISHIRRAALGEPLIPFAQRVDKAMAHIEKKYTWNDKQRKWLQRLAKRLIKDSSDFKKDIIVDHEFINDKLRQAGGVKGSNKVLDNQLDKVLEDLNEAFWSQLG